MTAQAYHGIIAGCRYSALQNDGFSGQRQAVQRCQARVTPSRLALPKHTSHVRALTVRVVRVSRGILAECFAPEFDGAHVSSSLVIDFRARSRQGCQRRLPPVKVREATILTNNKGFEDWADIFEDEIMTAP